MQDCVKPKPPTGGDFQYDGIEKTARRISLASVFDAMEFSLHGKAAKFVADDILYLCENNKFLERENARLRKEVNALNIKLLHKARSRSWFGIFG